MTIEETNSISITNTEHIYKHIKENLNVKEEDYSLSEKVNKILEEKRKRVQPIYNAEGKLIKRPYSDINSSVDIII